MLLQENMAMQRSMHTSSSRIQVKASICIFAPQKGATNTSWCVSWTSISPCPHVLGKLQTSIYVYVFLSHCSLSVYSPVCGNLLSQETVAPANIDYNMVCQLLVLRSAASFEKILSFAFLYRIVESFVPWHHGTWSLILWLQGNMAHGKKKRAAIRRQDLSGRKAFLLDLGDMLWSTFVHGSSDTAPWCHGKQKRILNVYKKTFYQVRHCWGLGNIIPHIAIRKKRLYLQQITNSCPCKGLQTCRVET